MNMIITYLYYIIFLIQISSRIIKNGGCLNMGRDANDVAKYIINKCTIDECAVSDLQLQKILYFIQLNFIRQFNYLAFDNPLIAKQYGPIVRSVYETYKVYGASPIMLFFKGTEKMFNKEERIVADWVIETCRERNPWELVEKSHIKGGPWDRTEIDSEIPKELLVDYALNGVSEG